MGMEATLDTTGNKQRQDRTNARQSQVVMQTHHKQSGLCCPLVLRAPGQKEAAFLGMGVTANLQAIWLYKAGDKICLSGPGGRIRQGEMFGGYDYIMGL